MDVVYDLVRNIIKTRYEDLSPEVVEATKMSILDTLGVTVAASTLGQGCKEIVDLVKDSGAKGKSSILGYGGRVPSWMAGLANGSMTHQLDYDDVREDARVHPGPSSVIPTFALAEELGNITGKDVLTAVATGIDLISRMGKSIVLSKQGHATDWHLPLLFGYYGAAAASGKIMGLDEEALLNTFGHTLQQASGSMQYMYSPGSIYRGIRDGFSIKGGMLAALMAAKGLPATKESLEGKAGLFDLFFHGGYDRSYLTDQLGKKYEGDFTSYKPWPACRGTHPTVDAALQLVLDNDIKASEVASIDAWVSKMSYFVVEPLEARRKPETIMDARLSVPFSVALAVARRSVVLADFTLEGLKDPAILELAKKITGHIEPELKDQIMSSIVEIKTTEGRKFSKRVDFPYGHPNRPIAKADLVSKFRDCVKHSAKPISAEDAENVIRLVDKLEDIKDPRKIVRTLA
jgi:2-methylcitrate dehydratase PrpD